MDSHSISKAASSSESSNKTVSLDYESGTPQGSDTLRAVSSSSSNLRLLRRRLWLQRDPWILHLKAYVLPIVIGMSVQMTSFIFFLLRCFSPVGDPVSFTIAAGSLFAISFAFLRATVPEGPPFLAPYSSLDLD